MIYTIPDYYKEFHCLADKCEDTCCAGWQIVIDKKSLDKYKRVRGDFAWRMFSSVNWFQGTFRQDKEKRCAFLNEHNLCDMYSALGEKSLCKTCRQYPRHVEEFEGIREITLSISCPEVARILMERKNPVEFVSYEKEGEEEYEDFDPFLFSILEDARAEMIKILQDRSLSIRTRVVLVLGMAHDMQGRFNREELFDCYSVMDKYCGEAALEFAKKYETKPEIGRVEFTREEFEKQYRLELLREEWDMVLQEAEVLLYNKGEAHYNRVCEAFDVPDLDIYLEQLLVYFLFTYFPGAVYDGRIYAKAKMAVYCTWMIRELMMARWLKNDKTLQLEDVIDVVYRFSREVEHSDENLKRVERMMEMSSAHQRARILPCKTGRTRL